MLDRSIEPITHRVYIKDGFVNNEQVGWKDIRVAIAADPDTFDQFGHSTLKKMSKICQRKIEQFRRVVVEVERVGRQIPDG